MNEHTSNQKLYKTGSAGVLVKQQQQQQQNIMQFHQTDHELEVFRYLRNLCDCYIIIHPVFQYWGLLIMSRNIQYA